MADTPELPEAKDPFEKMVAISIAVMAVLLSYISMKGDNAKTDSVIKTNLATDQWGFYQSKSLKRHMAESEADLLKYLSTTPESTKRREELKAEAEKYKTDSDAIQKEAKKLEVDADDGGKMNDRCDFAGLFLQIAIVIASVAILSRQRLLWYASLGLALFGAAKFFFL